MAEVHLSSKEVEEVLAILQAHVPPAVQVHVFGSRATGRGVQPHSDLDLLLDAQEALPYSVLGDLREAFSLSNLPFRVDLLQRVDASDDFLASIHRAGLIELPILSTAA